MGSLFAIGGILKIEAKSFIKTLTETQDFPLMAPLINEENPIEQQEVKYLRELNKDDIDFFKKEFPIVVSWFINQITKGLEKVITNTDGLNLLIDLTYDKFYDDMTEMERKEPQKLDRIMSAHFVTKFLIDVL